jgi:hypothetical protein
MDIELALLPEHPGCIRLNKNEAEDRDRKSQFEFHRDQMLIDLLIPRLEARRKPGSDLKCLRAHLLSVKYST